MNGICSISCTKAFKFLQQKHGKTAHMSEAIGEVKHKNTKSKKGERENQKVRIKKRKRKKESTGVI